MMKIGFIGAPGVGKTTMASGLFHELKACGYNAEFVDEYIRGEIKSGWYVKTVSDNIRVFIEQQDLEVKCHCDIMVTDSPIFLPFVYGLRVFDGSEHEKRNLFTLYELFLNSLDNYDMLFFLESSREYIHDGVRQQSADEAKQVSEHVKSLLDMHNVNYQIIKIDDENSFSNHISTIMAGIESQFKGRMYFAV